MGFTGQQSGKYPCNIGTPEGNRQCCSFHARPLVGGVYCDSRLHSGSPFLKSAGFLEIDVSKETGIRNLTVVYCWKTSRVNVELISGKVEGKFFHGNFWWKAIEGWMQPVSQVVGQVMDLLLAGAGGWTTPPPYKKNHFLTRICPRICTWISICPRFFSLVLSRLPPRGHISGYGEERRSFGPRRRPPPGRQSKTQQRYSNARSASVVTHLFQEEGCYGTLCLPRRFYRCIPSPVLTAAVVTCHPPLLFGVVSGSSLNGTWEEWIYIV